MKIKENDYFTFRYDTDSYTGVGDPYWCFDGRLVAKKNKDGSIFLEDTYWGSGNNRTFTVEEVSKLGKIEFVCNLDEVDFIDKHYTHYYDDCDVFNLGHQHNCYSRFAIKRGAKKSKIKMIYVLTAKKDKLINDVVSNNREIERIASDIQELNNPNVNINDIYI